jgi:hypothetical protein
MIVLERERIDLLRCFAGRDEGDILYSLRSREKLKINREGGED